MLPEAQAVSRNRKRAVLLLFGTFLAGVATGAGGYAGWRSVRRSQRMASMGSTFSREGFLKHYDRSLDLTDAQKEQLRPAFERHAAGFIAINRKSLPDHRELNHALDVELLHVLTPEQMPKFTRMQEGREKFLRGWAGEQATVAEPAKSP
jgi:Spy/CpxP family protein refolding chaperone